MSSSSDYNENNILELEELCMEEVETYLASRTCKVEIKVESEEGDPQEKSHSRGIKRKYAV